jgi:hypothetical protein
MSHTFQVIKHDTARSYLDVCEAALLKTRPTQANLPILSARQMAVAESTTTTPAAATDNKAFFYTITLRQAALRSSSDDSPIVLTLAHVYPYPAVLGSSLDPSIFSPDIIKGALKAFADALVSDGLSATRLPCTTGPRLLVDAFADAWAKMHNLEHRDKPILHMYNTYVTKETLRPPVRPNTDNSISLGKIKMEELNIAANLLLKFFIEALPRNHNIEAATGAAKRYISAGEMFGIWVNGALKGLSVLTRPTPGVMAVAHVFTDPETRGKGLAELVVRYSCEQ